MIKQNPSQTLAARPRAGRFPVLFVLAGLLTLATPLRADNPPTYLFQIDSSAVPGGFSSYSPVSVALDSENNVYASDNNNGRIVKFSGGGTYLAQWGSYGSGNGQFNYPFGIAVNSSNNVYVADADNNRVEKFDSNGNYLTQWGSYGGGNGQFHEPEGIAADSSINVYVADTYNDRVEKFDSSGNYLTQWGTAGTNNGQFVGPEGIAVDSSNNVYVADTFNNRVEKFDSNGNYLTQWGSFGSGNGQFYYPFGIAMDSSDNVYVADSYNNRVEKFTSSGNYLTQWGSSGSGHGQFESPYCIAVDRSGNVLYVPDSYNSRIEVFVYNTNTPFITLQPANQTVPAGFNVIFSVSTLGTAPLAWQWNSNNVAVAGATNTIFTLTNVSLSDSGAYSVLVTNYFGSALSSKAVLAVLPAFVTTQPASGLSASGAVLNGSVTVGPDETVVWFDWGTDTNYGDITGATIVPGNSGSNSISAALGGLPGNFYHYRLDAANDFGIVYGDDQLFTVGFAPAATTLPSTNGANGATLAAAVNPEGWDTIVYFQWETPTLANTTPGIDIGAGTTSVNVSSFVPGLDSFPSYQYQVVALNALGTTVGAIAYSPNQHHYFFSGSETNITLPPGTYIITAYGAAGGFDANVDGGLVLGGSGAEMSAEFNFSTSTTLTLLVGEYGDYGYGGYNGGGSGGGGGSFVVEGSTPLVIAGGGGGNGGYPSIGGGGNGSVSTHGGDGYGGYDGGYGGGVGGSGGYGGGGGALVNLGNDNPAGKYGGGGGGGFLGDGGDGENGGQIFIFTGYFIGGSLGIGGGGFSFQYGGGGDFDSDPGGGGFGGGGSGDVNYGGGGGGGGYSGGGGGGFNFADRLGYGGGGGGSIIDPSAIAILAEVLGFHGGDGEIIIIALPPPLAITADGANVDLTWPAAATGFTTSGYTLESATNLVPPVAWQTNSTPPIVIGGQNVITNPISGSQQFFRLFNP